MGVANEIFLTKLFRSGDLVLYLIKLTALNFL